MDKDFGYLIAICTAESLKKSACHFESNPTESRMSVRNPLRKNLLLRRFLPLVEMTICSWLKKRVVKNNEFPREIRNKFSTSNCLKI
jgi:hypothetical protein